MNTGDSLRQCDCSTEMRSDCSSEMWSARSTDVKCGNSTDVTEMIDVAERKDVQQMSGGEKLVM